MTLDIRDEAARGYMLIGILYIHALIAFAMTRADPFASPAALVQIKLLAPHVSVFFFMAGMGARNLGKKRFVAVLNNSLMLLLLASASHAIGYWIGPFLHDPPFNWRGALHGFARPLVFATDYCTFVGWFFVVLAIVRLLAHAFERGWRWFALGAALVGLIALASRTLPVPDNLYEWRNIPAATLFFLVGMRLPRGWRVPGALGIAALAATLALAWFNRPALLSEGPCLACEPAFVSQPMVGGYGSLPVFIAQEFSFLIFLLAAAQLGMRLNVAGLARYFGRHSVQLLLLHGWVMAALFPLILPHLPERESWWLLAAFLIVSPLFHAALLWATRPAIDRLLMGCMAGARIATRPFEHLIGRRGPARPI